MGASQATQRVGLPLFVDTDKPTWRGDFNGAMNTIDDQFTLLKSKAYDIRDYGAATTSADNVAAFQAAIDAAAANGGGVVWVPNGTWIMRPTVPVYIRSGVSVQGASRKGAVIKVADNMGDWGYLFKYDDTQTPADSVSFTNLTVRADSLTGVTTTSQDAGKPRTPFNLHGTNISVRDCDVYANGVWAIRVGGRKNSVVGNTVVYDLSAYTFADFDQSIIISLGEDSKVMNNQLTITSPSGWIAHTAIEFGGHRHRVANNTSRGSVRNGVIFAANTWNTYAWFPIAATGAKDNVIEGNDMEATQAGVDIWGLRFLDAQGNPDRTVIISDTRILNNKFLISPPATAGILHYGIGLHWGSGTTSAIDGVSTSPIDNLVILGNVINFASKNSNGTIGSGAAGVRLNAQQPAKNIKVANNVITGCGDNGIMVTMADSAAFTDFIENIDITGNTIRECRVGVRLNRCVRNVSITGNIFTQKDIYPNTADNMLRVIQSANYVYPTYNYGGKIKDNTVQVPATLKPFVPQQHIHNAESEFSVTRGFELPLTGVVQVEAPKRSYTLGVEDLIKRIDNTFAKSNVDWGSTIGTLTATNGVDPVTITSVTDAQTMVVSDAANIKPGQVLALPDAAAWNNGSSAFVVAVVGNTVVTVNNQLAAASGKTWADAVGKTLTYRSFLAVVS